MSLSTFFAFFLVLAMWGDPDRLCVKVRTRYLQEDTLSIVVSEILMGGSELRCDWEHSEKMIILF